MDNGPNMLVSENEKVSAAGLKKWHGLTPVGHQMLLNHPNTINWKYVRDMK
jgi:hypothetical protein